jgi:arylsulfatase A-like enzyme
MDEVHALGRRREPVPMASGPAQRAGRDGIRRRSLLRAVGRPARGCWKYTNCALDPEQLFDLETDPQELTNLADDPAMRPR